MQGLTEFLQLLETRYPEEVVRIAAPIDPRECDATAVQEYLRRRQRFPWLVFDDVKALDGSQWPGLFATYTDSSLRRVAIAYGFDPASCAPADITRRHDEGMRAPEEPERIAAADAPVKQIVVRGAELDLGKLPFFRNAEKDSRPGWATPIYICREFGTGRYNISWHRGQYVSRNRLTARFYPGRDIFENFNRHKAAGQKMRAVVVLGHHPVFGDGAGTSFVAGLDEYAGIGGIYRKATGERLRVVPSELWGDEMLVPADAEIVLEGHVLDEYEDAGPWCDYWRSYLPARRMNIFAAEVLTMRRRPIFHSIWPSSETKDATAAMVLERLRTFYPTVRDVNVPFPQTVIVSFRPTEPGQAMHLAATVLSVGSRVKTIIVIDSDLDPYDQDAVFFSLATRMDARRDVVVLPLTRNTNDPSSTEPVVGGLLIDATRPRDGIDFEIGLPPPDRIARAASLLPAGALQRIRAGSPHRLE